MKPASYPFILSKAEIPTRDLNSFKQILGTKTKTSGLICDVLYAIHGQLPHNKIVSDPDTVDMLTFWFPLASFLSICLVTKTHFGKR